MREKLIPIFFVSCLMFLSYGIVTGQNNGQGLFSDEPGINYENIGGDGYGIQWEMSYGSSPSYGARYEGPQPIGDCDGDGDNELLIGGRDAMLRVMEWDEVAQTYEQTYTLHCPFYPLRHSDPGGFAIGDLTGDGENEIAVTWSTTVHKWVSGRYRIIGFNPWIFWMGGGNADCLIGDCDNDGQNELIMSGGPFRLWSRVPEIVVFKWNGWRLVRVSAYDDPIRYGYVYMAGIGDVDEDGENEIVCGVANRGGSENKVVVLNWNTQAEMFEDTVIQTTENLQNWPFACICEDSDMDGNNEIHVGYYSPKMTVFEWNETRYDIKYQIEWPDEEAVIEALDVGDVDDDEIPEVCVGTNVVHILQWNGSSYVEEAVLPTYGVLAVTSIGDCDNDGINEINVGNVWVSQGQDFKSWVFKYGWV
jgi:hypothetical protein